MSNTTPTRRPYHGSCHCGDTQYIVFLTLPHTVPDTSVPPPAGRSYQRFYRCNCTTCHKASIFHTRLADAPDDFLLLSPRGGPFNGGLGDYQCNDNINHWLFCRRCAVRCFLFVGEGETQEVDLGVMGIRDRKTGEKMGKQMAWKPKREGWDESADGSNYLSVNGYTVDPNQEGFELSELTDAKVVEYNDMLGFPEVPEGPPRWDRPYKGGAY
jgi:hypothetical protein